MLESDKKEVVARFVVTIESRFGRRTAWKDERGSARRSPLKGRLIERDVHRASNERWNRFKGNVGETIILRDGVERIRPFPSA